MHEQNRIFISQVFEMEVSDGGGEIWNYVVSMEICRYPNIVQTWKPRGFHGNHVISKKISSSRAGLRFPIGIHHVRVEAVHFS